MVEDASDLDPIAGTYGMLAIMAALHHRDRTGEGQLIEIAQGEAGFMAVTEAAIEHVWNGREMGPQGKPAPGAGPPRQSTPAPGTTAGSRSPAAPTRSGARSPAAPATRSGWSMTPTAPPPAAARRAPTSTPRSGPGRRPEDETALTQRLQEAGVAAFPVMGVYRHAGRPPPELSPRGTSSSRKEFPRGGAVERQRLAPVRGAARHSPASAGSRPAQRGSVWRAARPLRRGGPQSPTGGRDRLALEVPRVPPLPARRYSRVP